MNERCLGLHLAYDGTAFQGYQVQPGQRTVQSELEAALKKVLGHPCATICAGRTDAGVHARAQFVHFRTSVNFPVKRLASALRAHLPPDMLVLQSIELPLSFHARYSALSRCYRYFLKPASTPDPFSARFGWHYPYSINRTLLQKIWLELKGTYDFRAFCRRGSYRTQTRIEIQQVSCTDLGNGWIQLDIQAQSFLYNMVRTLVGTALEIARGRFGEDHLRSLLEKPERQRIGLTAPPQGLFLWNVNYPPMYGLDLAATAAQQLNFQLF